MKKRRDIWRNYDENMLRDLLDINYKQNSKLGKVFTKIFQRGDVDKERKTLRA